MRVTYPQLDAEAMALLAERLDHHRGSRAALARELGVSRSGISQAIDGKYPGDTRRLRARIIEILANQITCPHLGIEMPPQTCRSWRERPITAATGSRDDVKHWQACQHCHHNPIRREAAQDSERKAS